MTDRVTQDGSGADLVGPLTRGRAILLLGQRHSPGLFDSLGRDLAAITGRDDNTGLIRLLADLSDPSTLEGLRRAAERHPVAPELLELADNPWPIVLTSAIDPQVREAFQRVAAVGRQLRVLYAGHTGTLSRPGQGTLTLLRLYGAIEEREPGYRPPTSDLELKRRTRLELALVLNELPALIGPGGQLVVVGVGRDDWLDLEGLALSCADLPAGSVHWFPSTEQPVQRDTLDELFGDRIRHYAASLADELARTSTDDEREMLERVRGELNHPASRHITLKQNGRSSVLTLSPQEWRRLSQVAVILDDGVTQPRVPAGEQEERQAFRDFLFRVQRIPDWDGIARDFLFERDAAATLLALVEDMLAAPGSVHAPLAADDEIALQSSRLPVLIEGPPASGKSRLLHWLAFQLRTRGRLVAYVPPIRGRTSFEQVERVCRLLEEKAEAACALIVDDLDRDGYEQLSEVLASSGRRSVVIGAVNSLAEVETADDSAPGERRGRRASYVAFPLASQLSEAEADRFVEFLAERKFPDLELARSVVRARLFLLLLYRLLPDSRGNIHLAIGTEYERLAHALEQHLDSDATAVAPTAAWQDQLAAIKETLFPKVGRLEAPADVSPFRHGDEVVSAVRLALFCSQIERPLSLDLLLRTQGSTFLNRYQAFSLAMEETALLQETVLDSEGTVGVEAEHPFVAEVALRTLLPDKPAQLGLLEPLIKAVRWDDSAFPGENPDQDYLMAVLQAVGPRGASGDKFSAPGALERLVALLAEIRLVHGTRLPPLLLLEANTLRLLANVATSSFEDSVDRCRDAIDILFDAEQILASRRPSVSRNAQLQNMLTTRAAVHGFICGACLREYTGRDAEGRRALRTMLQEHLEEVNRDTVRARSMGRATYYPLDVSFWAHRDQLERLPDLTDEERISLVAKLESVLEIAAEEPIEMGQHDLYRRRIADLADLRGDTEIVEAVVLEMRARGDFSADCMLARRKAIDPHTRALKSTGAAREALDDLLSLAPAILGSEEALGLMHHLWLGAHLDGQLIGGAKPVLAQCRREDWVIWRRIIEARLALPANEANPYLGFCLAWTLLSLDEPLSALQVLRANEALALGNRRRVGTLAIVADEDGSPVEYTGIVRRIDGQLLSLYVPWLLSEIKAPARTQTELALSARVGDEWRFGLGINYQGVLPVTLNG